jgi:hypothetical protein
LLLKALSLNIDKLKAFHLIVSCRIRSYVPRWAPCRKKELDLVSPRHVRNGVATEFNPKRLIRELLEAYAPSRIISSRPGADNPAGPSASRPYSTVAASELPRRPIGNQLVFKTLPGNSTGLICSHFISPACDKLSDWRIRAYVPTAIVEPEVQNRSETNVCREDIWILISIAYWSFDNWVCIQEIGNSHEELTQTSLLSQESLVIRKQHHCGLCISTDISVAECFDIERPHHAISGNKPQKIEIEVSLNKSSRQNKPL